MSKRKSISIAFKKEVISYIEDNKCNVHKAYVHFSKTRKLSYSESQYYQWWRKKDEIKAVSVSKKRCKGGGRKAMLGNLKEIIFSINGPNEKKNDALLALVEADGPKQASIKCFFQSREV